VSARGVWIVALGAALAGLVALNVFRSAEPESAAGTASPPPSVGQAEPLDSGLATQRTARDVGATSSESRADAIGVDGGDAAKAPSSPIIRSATPHASISQVLIDAGRERVVDEDVLRIDRAFAAESEDPTWSTAAEANVLGRIAEVPGLALVSLNVECRTTLCLLQFVTPRTPSPNAPDTGTVVRASGLRSLYMMAIRDRSGAPVSLAYLQRNEAAPVSPDVPESR
jgi:hypothetical protein